MNCKLGIEEADLTHRFSSISGMAFFLAWLTIIACNWRFRLALRAQNDPLLSERFAYRATMHPWFSIVAFLLVAFMVVCQFIVSIWPIDQPRSAANFFKNFLGIPIFLIMWAGYKIVFWRSGKARMQRLQDIDLTTGRRVISEVEFEKLVEHEGWGIWKRMLSYLRV